MSSIDDDYVKIVMHAQVQVLEQVPPDEQASLAGAQYQAADDPVQGTAGMQRALAAGPAPGEEVVFAPERRPRPTAAQAAARRPTAEVERRSSRTRPSNGPGATTPARAGAARSSSSATGAERCRPTVRDFDADLARARAGGWTRRRAIWTSTASRARLAELEAELCRPDLWDDTERGPAGDPRVRAGQGRRRPARRPGGAGSPTPRRCTSWPWRRTTTRSPPSWRPVGRRGGAARRAGAAVAVHRRARRARRGRARSTPRTAAPTPRTGPR